MKHKYYKITSIIGLCFSTCLYQTAFAADAANTGGSTNNTRSNAGNVTSSDNPSLNLSSNAFDNAFKDFIKNTTINGDIRNYYFLRHFTNTKLPDQTAYSLGGNLRILSGSFFGFQAGAALYTAQNLGLNSDNPKNVDQSLPGKDVTVLGQAYLQYQNSKLLVRGGDQLINTPWMNAADSRMIPATYRGIYGSWSPQSNISIIAMRMYEFKSRIADNFSATNLYTPGNGGTPIPALANDTFPGAQAAAITFKNPNFNSQLWGYQFFDFGRLLYGDTQYTFAPSNPIHPFIGVQAVHEWGDGDNVLGQVSNGAADAKALGAQLGLEAKNYKLTASYNKVFSTSGAFNNGDIVSPYTSGYASDPLYTTSMIAGLIEKAPGDAFKIAGTAFAFDKQLQITTSYARYFTTPFLPNTGETDFDVTYTFPKSSRLKGLSIRNRFGVLTGNPNYGTFYNDRIMLQYSF